MTDFEKSFDRLLFLCRETLPEEVEKESPEWNLGRYLKLYDELVKKNMFGPEIQKNHKKPFHEILSQHEKDIFNDSMNTKWILNNSIVITPYRDDGVTKSKRNLNITYFYRLCLSLAEKAEEKSKMNKAGDDELNKSSEYQAIIYPDRFVLYLYRIFRTVADDPSQLRKIDQVIKKQEEELGLTSSDSGQSSIGEGIGSIIKLTNNVMKSNGISPVNADGDQIGNIIQNAMNNPVMKNLFGQIVQTVQSSDNIGEALGNVSKHLQNPDVIENVSSIGKQAQDAVGGIKKEAVESTDDVPVVEE